MDCKDPAFKAALLRWWNSLEDDRGGRAELRRCSSLMDVLQTPAFHSARQRLTATGFSPQRWQEDRLAIVIALAAHLRSQGELSAPKAFSQGERPSVSPLRFRQILEARDDDELFRRLRRILPLTESLSLSSFAEDLLGWSDSTRKRWIYDYHWPQKQTA